MSYTLIYGQGGEETHEVSYQIFPKKPPQADPLKKSSYSSKNIGLRFSIKAWTASL